MTARGACVGWKAGGMLTPSLRRRLAKLARTHHGVVTREELLGIGFTRRTIDLAVDRRLLVRLFPGVYRVNGAPDTWRGRALAAQRRVERHLRRKSAEAPTPPLVAVGERAAAHLHGLPGHTRRPAITVVASHRCRSSLVTVRTRHSFTALDLVEVDRIPTVSVAWNMVELAGLLTTSRYADAVAHVFGSGALRPGQLLGAAHRAQGVPGRTRAISAAQNVKHTYRSGTERTLYEAFVAVGIPPSGVNEVVTTSSGLAPECDYFWCDEQVDVELDGPHHLLPSQRTHDRQRDRALRADGVEVYRIPVEEVDEDPVGVAQRVKAILEARSRRAA